MVDGTLTGVAKRAAAFPRVLATSSETGAGLPELRAEIAARGFCMTSARRAASGALRIRRAWIRRDRPSHRRCERAGLGHRQDPGRGAALHPDL